VSAYVCACVWNGSFLPSGIELHREGDNRDPADSLGISRIWKQMLREESRGDVKEMCRNQLISHYNAGAAVRPVARKRIHQQLLSNPISVTIIHQLRYWGIISDTRPLKVDWHLHQGSDWKNFVWDGWGLGKGMNLWGLVGNGDGRLRGWGWTSPGTRGEWGWWSSRGWVGMGWTSLGTGGDVTNMWPCAAL